MADRYKTTVAAVLAVEGMLLAAGASATLPLPVVVIAHILVVAVFGALAWRQTGKADAGLFALALVATAITGPFGALGALALPSLTKLGRDNTELLVEWYDRISNSVATDPLTQRSDHVAIGRAADLAAPLPPRFDTLFASADIAGQQTALGMIARQFHPSYIPALRAALDSAEPLVRVQAAAVTARVRDKITNHLGDGLERASEPSCDAGEALRLLDEVAACARSGLVGENEAARAQSAIEKIRAEVLARLDARRREGTPLHLGNTARPVYERHLLQTGEYEAFRDLRRRRREHVGGRLRRRTISAVPTMSSVRRRGEKQ